MTKKEKLLEEITKISRDNNVGDGETWLGIAGLKALFNYTSAKNLNIIRDYLLWEVENSKNFKEEENE